jgi:hypothetical protein
LIRIHERAHGQMASTPVQSFPSKWNVNVTEQKTEIEGDKSATPTSTVPTRQLLTSIDR